MADCIFCKIASGAVSALVVHETPTAIAFLDVNPLADGHTMIVPRAHFERLTDVPAETVGALFEAVREVRRKVGAAVGAADATVGINDGPGAGQVVPHLHIHVIPRTAGDGGGNIHSIIRRPAKVPLPEMQARIRAAG